MKKVTYLAVFEPSDNGSFSIYFPDFPGCISYGADFNKASRMAQKALALHYYEMEKAHDLIPEPSLSLDPEDTEGNLISPITIFPEYYAGEQRNKRVKTNTTIPAWLKAKAEENGLNFSHVLENALIQMLAE